MNYSHVSPTTLNVFIDRYNNEISSLQKKAKQSVGLAKEVFIIRIEELEELVLILEQHGETHERL